MTDRPGTHARRGIGMLGLVLLVAVPPAVGAPGARGGEAPAVAPPVLMRGHEWNLCTTMDFVGVGRIEATEYRPFVDDVYNIVITVAQLRVERTVASRVETRTGDVIEFAVGGGIRENGKEVVDLHQHYPEVGEWWAVAFEMNPQSSFEFPVLHGAYRASERLSEFLPEEAVLQRAWEKLCRLQPEGVYESDLLMHRVPDEVLLEIFPAGPSGGAKGFPWR